MNMLYWEKIYNAAVNGRMEKKMDIKKFMSNADEKPLDNLVSNSGFCADFRTIGCIGDSLSSGELESMELGERGYHDYFEYSWGQFIARDAGCKVYNFSRGGMTAREYISGYAAAQGFLDPALRCQAYIIALGVNDVSQILNKDLELGSIEDIHPTNYALNKPTFAGWYSAIISKYKTIEPNAKFFLMTMPKSTEDEKRSALYDQHAKLLYEIAEKFSNCYLLDFRKYAPKYDEEFRRRFFVGGHLNVSGYRLTALMVESYIDYIIRNNPDDFSQCGFIGKQHAYSE